MPASTELHIDRADLNKPRDAADYRAQLNLYAKDAMGVGRSLPGELLGKVTEDLAKLPNAKIYLARQGTQAAGFATCFTGYSTFRAMPLWNIHDIAVTPELRGRGIATAMIEQIARDAAEAGCCKLTLEVREDNPVAERLYRHLGFAASRNDEQEIPYRFLERQLEHS